MWTEGEHPDLEQLLTRASGLQEAKLAAAIDAHLADCALCRLELKRAARFAELDSDEVTAETAGWKEAQAKLDAAWHERRPAAVARRRPRAGVPRWLMPAAAAAVVAVVVLNVGDFSMRGPFNGGEDTLRGVPPLAPSIATLAPLGDIETAPGTFAWETERAFNSFALEIFTESLGTVLRLEDLRSESVELSDSLRALFAADTTYFWHVEGQEGLMATAASATVWFRITPPSEG